MISGPGGMLSEIESKERQGGIRLTMKRGPRMIRSTIGRIPSSAAEPGIPSVVIPSSLGEGFPLETNETASWPLSARVCITTDGPLSTLNNRTQFSTINLHVTARGGVASEESVFERSLQSTVTANPLQVQSGGEVTGKIDIGGTAANAWHCSQGDFLTRDFLTERVSRWGIRVQQHENI